MDYTKLAEFYGQYRPALMAQYLQSNWMFKNIVRYERDQSDEPQSCPDDESEES